MKSSRIIKLAMLGSIALSCVEIALADVTYSFTTINVPGAFQTAAEGINNAGQIVGLTNVPIEAFLYSNGSFTAFSCPGGTQTDAHGINNGGQIVGECVSGGVFHGFVDTGGSFTSIEYPSAVETFAYGINDLGQIVGDFYDGTEYHGFLYSGGIFTAITAPSASCSFTCGTFATGINDKGQIVGYFGDGVATHGFLYSGGSFTLIDAPGVSCSGGFEPCGTFLSGINNKGQIVGTFVVGIPMPGGAFELNDHGFLYADGSFTTINDPTNPIGTFASGINDRGQIAGHFLGAPSGGPGTQGFLATPVPSIPFASFEPRLRLDVDEGSFDLKARFALGEGGTINPLTEPVTLGIGPYSVTIPAGSFKRDGEGYRFEGVIAGVRLEVSIHRNEGRYSLRAEGRGANLSGIANPVAVSVSIGDNTGSTKVTADFD